MPTDERPPPWYKSLVTTLRSAWEREKQVWRECCEESARCDPWTAEERRVLWEDMRCPFKEQIRDPWRWRRELEAIQRRRRDLLNALRGHSPDEDEQANHPTNE